MLFCQSRRGLIAGGALLFTKAALAGPGCFLLLGVGTAAPAPPCCCDGTKVIFTIGRGITTRNKYTLATCCSASATAASGGASGGAAAGNKTRGISQLANSATTSNKYTYACDTSAAATAFGATVSGGSAAGNSTRGIFARGSGTTTKCKYTYACDTRVGATASGGITNFGAGVGTSAKGIFARGVGNTTSGDKYTYACDTNSSITNLLVCTPYGVAAAGNATKGIFNFGNCSGCCTLSTSAIQRRFTFACCAVATISNSPTNNLRGAGAGNSVKGIFAAGNATNTRYKFTYSGCATTTSGVGVASTTSCAGAASGWATGVNV